MTDNKRSFEVQTPFGPMNIEEVKPEPPEQPLRLVGLEPGRDRKVVVIDVESLEHALFVIQEGEDKGRFFPSWIEDARGFILYAPEQLYVELRKRQATILEKLASEF